eukprot:EG_transcript_25755
MTGYLYGSFLGQGQPQQCDCLCGGAQPSFAVPPPSLANEACGQARGFCCHHHQTNAPSVLFLSICLSIEGQCASFPTSQTVNFFRPIGLQREISTPDVGFLESGMRPAVVRPEVRLSLIKVPGVQQAVCVVNAVWQGSCAAFHSPENWSCVLRFLFI